MEKNTEQIKLESIVEGYITILEKISSMFPTLEFQTKIVGNHLLSQVHGQTPNVNQEELANQALEDVFITLTGNDLDEFIHTNSILIALGASQLRLIMDDLQRELEWETNWQENNGRGL